MGYSRSITPPAKAYLLVYLSNTGPRVLSLLVAALRDSKSRRDAPLRLWFILRQAAAWDRLPAVCAVLVAGSTILQRPLHIISAMLINRLRGRHSPVDTKMLNRMVRFVAALVAAALAFQLLNHRPSEPLKTHAQLQQSIPSDADVERQAQEMRIPRLPPQPMSSEPLLQSAGPLAGRSIDLTLFAVVRALDVLISPLISSHPSRFKDAISTFTPPFLFWLSSATIMHAWFYSPYRLPRTYNAWISSAANLDSRLLSALRHARYGTFVYGKDTGLAPLLTSMCKDHNWPEIWGDPAKTIPVPCEMVHQGCGPSCEKHALWRFYNGWLFAAKMYIPLQLLVELKRLHRSAPTRKQQLSAALRALVDASRNSAFLAAFVALFYYGVCLSRTRLGPRLFSTKTVTPQMWDSGLCVAAGCALCGWSVLLEKARRRTEIVFFVLPRALAVWFPRRYLRENRWREHVAFAVSVAVVFAAVQERPERVRGVFGRVLGDVLKTG
ncbi:hypothetical protein K490DRAFT_54644 [Saccharata proteae CBS 121410]|uniref:Integral membrane protein n=1 Tax=Saccharata proteae CBS 121410 TaxID=1314787 RepID=A0A9P4HW38_9PEZI|nr:hypothetical protein K490DRAFT_54644 [Saccharata proteae CBS 121410]